MGWMKGKNKVWIVGLLVGILLVGCQTPKEENSGEILSDSTALESTKYDFISEEEQKWEDNSLDDWQAIVNLPIRELKAEGEQLGGAVEYIL